MSFSDAHTPRRLQPLSPVPSTAVLRVIEEADAPAVAHMLAAADGETAGMLALPRSREEATHISAASAAVTRDLAARSFEPSQQTKHQLLFVLEADGDLVGVTGVTFKIDYPNLAIRLATGRQGQGLVMKSVSEPWSRTELDSSFMAPAARGAGHGATLSRGRFMLLHLVRHQIPPMVVAHLRGRFDHAGQAPFWFTIRHQVAPQWRTSSDAEQALAENPDLLATLAGHVIPVEASALGSLGVVNEASKPAFALLLSEGLEPNGMYDPVDGGPTVAGQLATTATHHGRQHGRARVGDPTGGADSLVATSSVVHFRATRAQAVVDPEDRWVTIDAATAARLGVSEGDVVTVAPLPRTGPSPASPPELSPESSPKTEAPIGAPKEIPDGRHV